MPEEPYEDKPPEIPQFAKDLLRQLQTARAQGAVTHASMQNLSSALENKLFPELLSNLQNDIMLTNMDVFEALGIAHTLTAQINKKTKSLSYWATSHVFRYLAALLLLQAEEQRKAASALENIEPGTTTRVGDVHIPADD